MSAPEQHLLSTAAPCQVHAKHHPQDHLRHRHHVWPLGKGGPDEEANIVAVCPTGHTNIHILLDLLLGSRDGTVPWTERRRFTTGERRYADLGYQRIRNGHL